MRDNVKTAIKQEKFDISAEAAPSLWRDDFWPMLLVAFSHSVQC